MDSAATLFYHNRLKPREMNIPIVPWTEEEINVFTSNLVKSFRLSSMYIEVKIKKLESKTIKTNAEIEDDFI